MASAAPLKDIDEQFLQCVICLDQLKEPKLLPCLHRYCWDCLKKIVKEKDKKIQCPTCREEHDIPEDGVDGFKSDFNTKNIIEFIQLQDSVKHEPLKVCANCSKKLKVASYCFRCNDFLCQKCHVHHKTSKIVQDHRPHIFSLDEVEARNLTIDRLSSLKEAPKCRDHPEKVSELCCTTCDNLPICIACTYGAHRGHALEEVKSLAKVERGKLTEKLTDLRQYEVKIYRMQADIKNTKEKLGRTVDEKKRKLKEELDAEEQTITREIRAKDEELKQRQTRLEEMLKRNTSEKKQKLEKEMKELRGRYDNVCEEERREADAELRKLHKDIEKEKAKLEEKLVTMNNDIQKLLESLKTQEEENTKKIQEFSDHFDDMVKRFEIATTTASSILAAKNDWTDVQCIAGICAAIDPLIEEARRDFPGFKTLSDIPIRGLSSLMTGRRVKVDISEREESVHIAGINEGWEINGITSNKDGSIVITGFARYNQSHITVINRKGEQLRQDIIHSNYRVPWRLCDYLSRSHIVTVGAPYEIGIYDIRDGKYRKINIRDVISSCPSGLSLRAVTVDPVNNHIIVGGQGSRNVYVFNSELKYIHTLALPEIIKCPMDMTVHAGNLLVCDLSNKRTHAVTMKEGSACKIMYEFSKPDVDGGDWSPRSMCTDKSGFIYMVWGARISRKNRSILVQYSHDGGQLLTTRSLDQKYYSQCITTVDTEQGEKIVIPTLYTRELIIYGVVMSE